MSQAADGGFTQLASRVPPNAALRLLQREIWGHRPGAAVHTARAFSECILPTHKVVDSESPDVHIGRFTQSGDALVCFTPQLDALVLFDYLGPVPQQHQQQQQQQQGHDASSPAVCFHRFFRKRWRLVLCPDAAEQLSRDFCVSLRDGAFLLLASTTPQRREGGNNGAAAAGGAPEAGAAAAPTAAAGGGAGDQQRPGLEPAAAAAADGGGDEADQGQLGTAQRRMPSSDCADMTTFHVVDVRRCIKVDERRFPADHFDLSGNGCVSIYDHLLSLTSIRTQTIHLLQVNRDGTLLDIQHIGRDCRPDDDVPVQLAAAAEQQWQLAKQQERQQQQFWVHQQARALLPARHRPAGPQQRQQQRHASPVVAPPGGLNSVAPQAAAAAATDGRQRRRTRGSSSDDDGEAGNAAGDASGDASDDSLDRGRRRVRRRVEPGVGQQQQQVQGQATGAATRAAGAIAAQAPRAQAAGPALAQPQSPTAAAGGAAAAAAATAAAVLDPGGQLIQGLRQRLLAHLLKAAASKAPCDVAPTQWDFQHNFNVLSSLVVWRARLLGRHRLLLKFGAPTSGTAAAAELNPSRVHFYGVYDTRSTRFSGFWKADSPVLLAAALERSCALLTAKPDLSPWERCCAAALYPQGVPIGLEQAPQRPGQPQQQGQQQAEGGAAPQAAAGRPRSISGHGGGGGAGEAAGGSSSRRRRSSAQGAAAAGGPAAAADGGGGTHIPAAAAAAEPPTAAGVPRGSVGGSSSGSSSSKAARERLKVLRQVVLLVLPGLQSLCPSPYLDPRLFSYSKQISPIIGLRNSPSQPLRFRLARRYAGFQPGPPADIGVAQDAAAVAASGPARDSGPAGSTSSQAGQRQQGEEDVLQLDAAQPPVVAYRGEDVARRQLYLLHPSDPFVLVIIQTIAQPAVLNLYHRV